MTAPIGGAPDMDAYRFIDYDDGYSRLDHLADLILDNQPDLRALNLRDAAEYRARHARIAHPHYRRHGRIDAVTGRWVPYTTDELADRAFDRKWRWLMFALYGVLVLAAGLAVVLALHGDGWLS